MEDLRLCFNDELQKVISGSNGRSNICTRERYDQTLTEVKAAKACKSNGDTISSKQRQRLKGSFCCGRCRPKGTPHSRFEEAAKKVAFPCAFGCGTHFYGKDVLQHEVYCQNRTVVCPFINCTTTSRLEKLYEHIKAWHAAYDQETPKLFHRLPALHTYLTCIKVDKYVVLFFGKFDHKADIVNFEYNMCLVWPSQASERLKFNNMQLKLKIEVPQSDLKVTKLIQCKNIDDYYDRSHCSNCVAECCDKTLHENKFNLPMHNIPLKVKDDSKVDFFYTIKVYKKETVSRKVPDSLGCPVCMDYMMNEIYLCENGHSLCGKCDRNRTQLDQKCPVCRGKMLKIRNYSMEKLAKQLNKINLPCRNKLDGCTFVGLVADVVAHEKFCKY